ncbi:P34-Arc-domain-containing protein, partial [Erysiphe pulchra]
MLLLDYQNVLIQSVLTERFSGAPPVNIDQTVSDFDGVKFHISTPESKSKIIVSVQLSCFNELVKYGALQALEREDDLIRRISLMKRNAMAAPFEHAFDEHHTLAEEASKFTSEEAPQGVREGGNVKAIHYRDEEAIYVKASYDRVTVIFSTLFRDETDRVFGKVFVQEFVDARRRAIQNAPQVLFRTDPPLELQGVPGVSDSGKGEIGYVTFGLLDQPKMDSFGLIAIVLFPRHLTQQRRDEVISHIQTFRDYFHYHIKASKVNLNLFIADKNTDTPQAYIHSRMRRRTADFLQVLRRAHPENEEREKKTA